MVKVDEKVKVVEPVNDDFTKPSKFPSCIKNGKLAVPLINGMYFKDIRFDNISPNNSEKTKGKYPYRVQMMGHGVNLDLLSVAEPDDETLYKLVFVKMQETDKITSFNNQNHRAQKVFQPLAVVSLDDGSY